MLKSATRKQNKRKPLLAAIREIQRKLGVDPSEQLLNSVTLVAGFLVIASFPLLTQDLSETSVYYPTHFSPKAVRTFAAISVGLFLTDIIGCQAAKLLFMLLKKQEAEKTPERSDDIESQGTNVDQSPQDAFKTSREVPKLGYFDLSTIVLVALLELLAAAIIFFLLIVTAYVYLLGMTFLVLDGVFACVCLFFLPLKAIHEWNKAAKQKLSDNTKEDFDKALKVAREQATKIGQAISRSLPGRNDTAEKLEQGTFGAPMRDQPTT